MRLSAKRLRGPLLRLGAWLLLLSACLGAHLPTASAIWEHDEVPETRGGGGSGRPWWAWEPFLEQSDAPRTPKHLRKGLGHEYSFYVRWFVWTLMFGLFGIIALGDMLERLEDKRKEREAEEEEQEPMEDEVLDAGDRDGGDAAMLRKRAA